MIPLRLIRSITAAIYGTLLLAEVCITHETYGQDSKIDSLRAAVAQATDPETKTQLLLDLFQALPRAEQMTPKGLLFIEDAFRLAQMAKLTEKLIEIYLNKAIYYQNAAEYYPDSSNYYYRKALRIARQQDNRIQEARILMYLGKFYFFHRQERHDSALYYSTKSIEVNEPTIDSLIKAQALVVLSFYYNIRGDHPTDLEYSLQAVAYAPDLPEALNLTGRNLDNLGRHAEAVGYYLKNLELTQGKNAYWEKITLSNLGRSYALQKEYEKALTYLLEAVENERKTTSTYRVIILDNLATVMADMGRYEEAIGYFREAIDFGLQYDFTMNLHMPFHGLGSTYATIHEVDSARKYLNLSLEYATKVNDAHYTIANRIELGKLDLSQGLVASGIDRLTLARKEALEADRKDQIIEADEALYQAHKQQGNYQQALRYHEEFKAYSDSVFNKESTAQITRLESQYAFDQEKQQLEYDKQQELLQKDSQLSRQRTFQIATAIALLVALVFVLIIARYYRLKQRANRVLTELNAEIQGQKEQLQELNQVKSRFFTNISHELRTPLTIIGGMAVQIEKAPDQFLKQGIRMIKRNNAQLLNLVNQILDLRKLESGTLQLDLIQGDIIFYLRYIVESFHSLAEDKAIKLHFLNQEKALMMDYDQEKILRVVSNLLSNAIKFTPQGGDVYLLVDSELLEVGNRETSDDPSLPDAAPSVLRLKVKDTGIGIPPEKIPYIFDRFYQVDDSTTRKGEGTGIGLALTKELLHLMGGEIDVESQVGKGTTFLITLPITCNAPLEKPEATQSDATIPSVESVEVEETDSLILEEVNSSSTPTTPPAATLLIIEDNMDVVSYLQVLLTDKYQLLIAHDGQQGIDMATEHIPDLIISDVMMPKKDGFEVCDTLKQDERTSHIPIVLLTAKADVDSRITGLQRGADAYLAKPFNQQELFIRLEKLHQLRQQLQARYRSLEGLPESMGNTDQPVDVHLEDAFILKLRGIVEDHMLKADFGIPELCREVGMSRSQLHLKIKALTDRSTSHFIRSIRLYKAKELLRHSELTVTEVGYEVGFQDPAYFSRTFAEEFGVSPREFAQED